MSTYWLNLSREVAYILMQEKIFQVLIRMFGRFTFVGMVKEIALKIGETLENVKANFLFPSFAWFKCWHPSLIPYGDTFHISFILFNNT
jgi:hypothetical protein